MLIVAASLAGAALLALRERARFEAALLAGALVVLTPGHFEVPFAYYAEREQLTLPLVVLPGVIPATPPHTAQLRDMGCAGPDRKQMALDAPDCPIAGWEGDVWLIESGRPNREPATSIRGAVSEGRSRVYQEKWGVRLRVARYARR